MKNIGIAYFEKLVMERLSNPSEFSDRSLVLWNSDFKEYSIVYRVLEQCCIEYNQNNPNDKICLFKSGTVFDTDDYTRQNIHGQPERGKIFSPLRRFGILFITGLYLNNQKDEWLELVNKHKNNIGNVNEDIVVIVCVQAQDQHSRWGVDDSAKAFLPKEDDFDDNCDIYCINPSIYEWSNWAKPFSDPELLELVCTYIKKNGVGWGFDYWLRIMNMLELLKENEDYSVNSIREIPQKVVKTKISGIIGKGNPSSDFCDFIYGNGW